MLNRKVRLEGSKIPLLTWSFFEYLTSKLLSQFCHFWRNKKPWEFWWVENEGEHDFKCQDGTFIVSIFEKTKNNVVYGFFLCFQKNAHRTYMMVKMNIITSKLVLKIVERRYSHANIHSWIDAFNITWHYITYIRQHK